MSNSNWWENDEVLLRVRNSMEQFIYGEQAVRKGQIDEAEFKDIRDIFHSDYPQVNFAAPGEYINQFKRWFSEHGHIYHSLARGATVCITRQYPTIDGGSITLSVGGNFTIRNNAALERVNESLLNMLESEYSRISAKLHKGFALPSQAIKPNAMTNGKVQLEAGEITVPITHLDTLYQEGRKMVRAYGGDFTKHGIPIYDEVLRTIGLSEKDMEVAKQLPINRTAIVRMKSDGKNPQKVKGWWD